MIQALVRSRLLYGMESCQMNEDSLDKLETFENNITKEYVNVSRRSYSDPILKALNMKPLRESLAIRRYSMLIQLLNNNFTMEIVLNDIERHKRLLHVDNS